MINYSYRYNSKRDNMFTLKLVILKGVSDGIQKCISNTVAATLHTYKTCCSFHMAEKRTNALPATPVFIKHQRGLKCDFMDLLSVVIECGGKKMQ